MRSLNGSTIVVTGGNSGIGFESAKVFAQRGATTVLACRNLDKAKAASDEITAASPDAAVELLELDLADLESVQTAAKEAAQRYASIDVLVNNAGVMAVPQRQTADGFELQFGTNHLGHFAFTGLLLPTLLAADRPRVVTVSSNASRAGRMRFTDINGERFYSRWVAYSQSKLANLLFAFELQRRCERSGAPLASVAAHPGWAATNLQAVGGRMRGGLLGKVNQAVMNIGNTLVAQPADAGAEPLVVAATAPNVEGGDYIGPSKMFELRGPATKVTATRQARNPEAAARLWQLSEQLTGVTYDALEAGS